MILSSSFPPKSFGPCLRVSRQLGKRPVVTEEEIQKVVYKSENGRSIRRMGVK